MFFRTDLALEMQEADSAFAEGVRVEEVTRGDAKITCIHVTNEAGEKRIGKPVGRYTTIELPPLTDNLPNESRWSDVVSGALKKVIPPGGPVLVCGLGNEEITPDALGPRTAAHILATRHIAGEWERAAGLSGLRPVSVLAPGVLGQTGIEAAELLAGIVRQIKPAAVVVIDALASRRLSRLGCTLQISDTGISPGSGVANSRPSIDQKTLGVPVIAIGVPTVVDAATLAADLLEPDDEAAWEKLRETVSPRGAGMIVAPREIDLLIKRAAALTALSLNCALQPSLSRKEIRDLIS